MMGWIVKDRDAHDIPAFHVESFSLESAESAWEAFREENREAPVSKHECVRVRLEQVCDQIDF